VELSRRVDLPLIRFRPLLGLGQRSVGPLFGTSTGCVPLFLPNLCYTARAWLVHSFGRVFVPPPAVYPPSYIRADVVWNILPYCYTLDLLFPFSPLHRPEFSPTVAYIMQLAFV